MRPAQIMTLATYLDRNTSLPAAPSAALVDALIREALGRLSPPRFAAVARYPGFRNAVAGLLDQVPVQILTGELRALLFEVQDQLQARGFSSRQARLIAAARSRDPLPAGIVFDGFFSFSPAERTLIESMADRTELTVTLPQSDPWLPRAGFVEQSLPESRRRPRIDRFSAPTLDSEVEEIARRILYEAAHGRPFREMGVILRVRDPYAPALGDP